MFLRMHMVDKFTIPWKRYICRFVFLQLKNTFQLLHTNKIPIPVFYVSVYFKIITNQHRIPSVESFRETLTSSSALGGWGFGSDPRKQFRKWLMATDRLTIPTPCMYVLKACLAARTIISLTRILCREINQGGLDIINFRFLSVVDQPKHMKSNQTVRVWTYTQIWQRWNRRDNCCYDAEVANVDAPAKEFEHDYNKNWLIRNINWQTEYMETNN